jgi:flavin-dependent dehydrogenase
VTAPGHDVVVVGGGPAGAAAACRLAREGRATLLLERETKARHKICGEFISVEAQAYLADLGIDPRALGGAPIDTVRLVHELEVAEAKLPFEAVGLTRRTLDEALLQTAVECGVTLRRGHTVRSVEVDGRGLQVCLRGEDTFPANTVFLATGKHDLRELKRPRRPSGADLIGFKTYFNLAPVQRAALNNTIEVILFKGGYAGLQHVEGGRSNLCLLVQQSVFERVGKLWGALLDHLCAESPHLRQRLTAAECLLDKPISISQVPYGFIHEPSASDREELFRLGDQMGVIPSFSGDGISIALHTAQVAVATYLERGNAASAYHRRVSQDISTQIRLASALYDVSRRRLGRLALLWACRLYPGILGTLATWTRVPVPALGRPGALSPDQKGVPRFLE